MNDEKIMNVKKLTSGILELNADLKVLNHQMNSLQGDEYEEARRKIARKLTTVACLSALIDSQCNDILYDEKASILTRIYSSVRRVHPRN
ncbi:hypothetical protein J2755_001741 [Methanohalophilus levihalophilus]|uniref:hypothetical protein n=1 Tax=Methanohalophilus levihalophilus TaxID=1431282 RepID=UPI001AE8D82D|nr:hypothetical protein [Methanohalophilus levihalophilus]MBP2030793.1 hypothetical protein [Methanohalophilus levihalophilus]